MFYGMLAFLFCIEPVRENRWNDYSPQWQKEEIEKAKIDETTGITGENGEHGDRNRKSDYPQTLNQKGKQRFDVLFV